jgi:hypothetical protein
MARLAVAVEQREQTRAMYPDETGFVERDGVRVCWERYGAGEQTVLLLPTWEIAHSRVWKCQIPDLARRRDAVNQKQGHTSPPLVLGSPDTADSEPSR